LAGAVINPGIHNLAHACRGIIINNDNAQMVSWGAGVGIVVSITIPVSVATSSAACCAGDTAIGIHYTRWGGLCLNRMKTGKDNYYKQDEWQYSFHS
jgi:hypothetical protein